LPGGVDFETGPFYRDFSYGDAYAFLRRRAGKTKTGENP
jgi:hypothetical protein